MMAETSWKLLNLKLMLVRLWVELMIILALERLYDDESDVCDDDYDVNSKRTRMRVCVLVLGFSDQPENVLLRLRVDSLISLRLYPRVFK